VLIYVLLTVYLITIFVNDQRDAQFLFLIFVYSSSLHVSEEPSAHHQESQLYQYDLWYMSLYVGDRVVCRFRWNCSSYLHTVTYTRGRIDTIDSPDDEHLVARNM